MTDFDDYQADVAPPWLGGPFGELWSRILGLGKQGAIVAAKNAVKNGFATIADPDALLEIAATFNLDVGFDEVSSRLRARILAAWETWQLAGTLPGMVRAFDSIGFAIEIREQPQSSVLQWWQFDVTIHPPFPWAGLAPENVPLAYRALFVALVRKWKPTHSECRRLEVNCYGETWTVRQARRGTWDAPPPEPWTGRRLVVAEGIL